MRLRAVVIFTWLVDFNSEPIAKTPKPEFHFWPRKPQPSYTYFDSRPVVKRISSEAPKMVETLVSLGTAGVRFVPFSSDSKKTSSTCLRLCDQPYSRQTSATEKTFGRIDTLENRGRDGDQLGVQGAADYS